MAALAACKPEIQDPSHNTPFSDSFGKSPITSLCKRCLVHQCSPPMVDYQIVQSITQILIIMKNKLYITQAPFDNCVVIE